MVSGEFKSPQKRLQYLTNKSSYSGTEKEQLQYTKFQDCAAFT